MPFVTISRLYGSGGSEVAERVARALGWALFDNAVPEIFGFGIEDRLASEQALDPHPIVDGRAEGPEMLEEPAGPGECV